MASQFLVTTTGTLSSVPIDDLGLLPGFIHPLISFDLLTEFEQNEIRESADLQIAIDNGYITVKNENGATITDIGNDTIAPFIKNNYSAVTDPTVTNDDSEGYSVGSRWINNSTGVSFVNTNNSTGVAIWGREVGDVFVLTSSRKKKASDSYLKTDESYTNEVPVVLPFDASLVAMSISTKGVETWSGEIHVGLSLISGALLSASSVDSSSQDNFNISFNKGDKLQAYCSGNKIEKPRITAVFRRR